jgi:hypothetical protein
MSWAEARGQEGETVHYNLYFRGVGPASDGTSKGGV